MSAWLFGAFFALCSIIFWNDIPERHLFMILANVWVAASYIRTRLAA